MGYRPVVPGFGLSFPFFTFTGLLGAFEKKSANTSVVVNSTGTVTPFPIFFRFCTEFSSPTVTSTRYVVPGNRPGNPTSPPTSAFPVSPTTDTFGRRGVNTTLFPTTS